MSSPISSLTMAPTPVTASSNRTLQKRLPVLFSIFVFFVSSLACCYIYSGCCIVFRPPIRGDGYGYYAYLPAVFVDHDFSMKTPLAYRWTVVANHPPPYNWTGIAMYQETGKPLDKYTSGTALLQMPFFLAAQAVARVFGMPPYSIPYQAANVLSGLAYFAAAIYLLFGILLRFFPATTSLLSLSAIVFGTNVFHFVTWGGSYSHVYSFFLLTVLLRLAYQYRTSNNAQGAALHCLGMGATLGLIVLTRVPNIIVGAIPLALVGEKYYKARCLSTLLLDASGGIAAFMLLFGLQLLYWHAVTGHYFVNSYQAEGFNWAHPEIINFLFSIKKGLFVWAPIIIIAIPGLVLLVSSDPVLWITVWFVLVLEVYICSSWWSWWFGAPFGSRPFVDMMPLICLALARGFAWLSSRVWGWLPVLLVGICIPANLFLMGSYWNELLPWNAASVEDLTRLPMEWTTHRFFLQRVSSFTSRSAFYTFGTSFDAGADLPPGISVEGFEQHLAPAIWTVGPRALIDFYAKLTAVGSLRLHIALAGNGALLTRKHARQRMVVKINDKILCSINLYYKGINRSIAATIPRSDLRDKGPNRIELDLPDAIAPSKLGINSDPRPLGLYVTRIWIDRAPSD